MARKNLQIQQISSKLEAFRGTKNVEIPPAGWIKAIRTAIGMSMKQMGNKLSMTKQSVKDIERR
jgi:DNA-binding transcriptional regulator YiaG